MEALKRWETGGEPKNGERTTKNTATHNKKLEMMNSCNDIQLARARKCPKTQYIGQKRGKYL